MIPSSPSGDTLGARENEPAQTQEILICAVHDTTTRTHHDYVSPQGFGLSTPLPEPTVSDEDNFYWLGRLHQRPGSGTTPSTPVFSWMGRPTLEEIADNFAENYRGHQSPELQARGEASYRLSFQPTAEQVEELTTRFPSGPSLPSGLKRTVRGLTAAEQEAFLAAFKKSNKAAQGN